MIKIEIHSTRAVIRYQEPLTVGLRGAKVRFSFGSPWEGLSKIAVFRQGEKTVTVADVGEEAIIPWEVLTQPGSPVQIGVYGRDSTGTVAIPTVWTETAAVRPGADPEGDPSTEPTPGVWEQLQGKMGSLEKLNTADKSSLVGAINEANRAFCLVTVTKNEDGSYSADKSSQQLLTAKNMGKVLLCQLDSLWLTLSSVYNTATFEFTTVKKNTKCCITIHPDGTISYQADVLATDESRLPNPKKITITGASTAEYDGSDEVEVQVPYKTSQLEHDSGFLTTAPVTSVNGQTGEVKLPTVVRVTVTKQSDGSYEPDLSCGEILAAFKGGNTVCCEWDNRVLSLVTVSPVACVFSGIHSEKLYTVTVFSGTSKAKVETISMASDNVDGDGYTLPVATPDTLGGVKPVTKSESMTQTVGVDEFGGLWTAPGSGTAGGSLNDNPLELINEITLDQETFLVEITKDANGEPFELEDFYLQVDALTTANGSSLVNGHLTINDVFMQSIQSGWGKDVTSMNYIHTLHYFNAGQAVFFGSRDGSSSWVSAKTSIALINRPITKVQINLSVSSLHYQVGASFKLYGRRVKK